MTTQNIFNLTDQWNNVATTFTAIKMNATDTASAAGSLLIDLQKDGVSQFSVNKSGQITAIAAASNYMFMTDTATWAWSTSGFGGVPQAAVKAGSFQLGNGGFLGFCSGSSANGTVDTFIRRSAAASFCLGFTDAAAPVAQTLGVQSVVAGTTNTAGANFTIAGSRGTGTGAGGALLLQLAPAGSSGSTQNALATVLTVETAVIGLFASVGYGYGWSSSAVAAGVDCSLLRYGAGQLRLLGTTPQLSFGGSTDSFGSVARDGAGMKIVGGAGGSTAHIKVPGVIVANLPAAATAGAGARSFVTDALAPTFGSAVTGGGAVNVPVYSTGAAWFVG